TDRQQQVRADDFAAPRLTIEPDSYLVAALFDGQALGAQPDADAFVFEDGFDGIGHVFILARNQPRGLLDDGHFAPEAAVHLAELQPDVAAADDDQVFGQEVHFHHARIVEEADLVEPGQGRPGSPAADVDEDFIRFEQVAIDAGGV